MLSNLQLLVHFILFVRFIVALEDYDAYGCCLSCGEYYCAEKAECVSDWSSCRLGYSDASHCTYIYNVTGSDLFSYNLAPYATDLFYSIGDVLSHPGQAYRYYFNLCQEVSPAFLPSVCNQTTGSGRESCSSSAFAYQYLSTSWGYEACYRLSDCFMDGSHDVELSLLDPVEPASGVSLTYRGGNTCANSYSDKTACSTLTDDWSGTTYCARSFKLNIKCHNEIREIPQQEAVVENAGCAYEATINHEAGCPSECPRSSTGSVCSARGQCFFAGYDDGITVDGSTVHPLQCLCEAGYTGTACEEGDIVSMASERTGFPRWLLILNLLAIALFSLLAGIVCAVKYFSTSQKSATGDIGADGRGIYTAVSTAPYHTSDLGNDQSHYDEIWRVSSDDFGELARKRRSDEGDIDSISLLTPPHLVSTRHKDRAERSITRPEPHSPQYQMAAILKSSTKDKTKSKNYISETGPDFLSA